MTAPSPRNDDGNYEIPGHGEKIGFSRIKSMKASKGLETFKLKRIASTLQWATATDEGGWVDLEPYDLVKAIDEADTEKADQGTCVGRACELLVTLGLTPAEAAKQAVAEQEAAVARWREWEAMTDYKRRKAGGKKAKPHRLNFTPPVDLVTSCVEGFANCVRDLGFRIVATEQTVFHDTLPYAGTPDIFGRFGDGPVQCWDIKNGRIHDDMAIQLAAYANATHWINADDDGLILGINPAPPIDRIHGGIFDVKEDRTVAIPFQLDAAWEAFKGLIAVRQFEDQRGIRGAALAVPTKISSEGAGSGSACVEVAAPGAPAAGLGAAAVPSDDPLADTLAWVQHRILAIKAHDGGLGTLKANWPAIPTKPPWTDEQLAAAVIAVVRTAELIGLPDDPQHPLGPPSPNYVPRAPHVPLPAPEKVKLHRPVIPADGEAADPEAVAALQRRGREELAPEERGIVQDWIRQSNEAGVPFGLKVATIGNFERTRAALECVRLVDFSDPPFALEEHVRKALAIVLDMTTDGIPTAWPTGAAIGILDLAQAMRLHDIAAAFPGGELADALAATA